MPCRITGNSVEIHAWHAHTVDAQLLLNSRINEQVDIYSFGALAVDWEPTDTPVLVACPMRMMHRQASAQ